MDGQNFCLKWDGFQSSVTSLFDHLRQDEELVDITLCCEGQRVKAHRMMLSACSPYFRDLLKNNPCQQMVIFLKDTLAADLHAIIEFMYKGSVNVAQSQLASFIKTAEMLQIRGLSGDDDKPSSPSPSARRRPAPTPSNSSASRPASPPAKRPRSSPTPTPPASGDGRPPATAAAGGGGEPSPPSPRPVATVAPPPADGVGTPLPASSRPAEPRRPADTIKVEKVDLPDDDTSLDATLGYVAEYEGGGYGDLSLVDSDPSRLAGVMPLTPGPSQRLGDDGGSQGKKKYSCDICGKTYGYRDSVYRHKRTHEGKTGCFVCGKVLSCMPTLREHLRFQHSMSQQEVACMVVGAPRPPGLAAATVAAATVAAAAGQDGAGV